MYKKAAVSLNESSDVKNMLLVLHARSRKKRHIANVLLGAGKAFSGREIRAKRKPQSDAIELITAQVKKVCIAAVVQFEGALQRGPGQHLLATSGNRGVILVGSRARLPVAKAFPGALCGGGDTVEV